MKIIYIDESGTTSKLEEGGSRFLCLTACALMPENKLKMEIELRKIKMQHYHPEVEFKSNYLRYANPSRRGKSPLKRLTQSEYDEMMKRIEIFLQNASLDLISVVIDKKLYWNQYPDQNPYEAAYIFLTERIQKYLEKNKELGLMIIDPREGRVDKSFIGDSLNRIHRGLRFYPEEWQNQCPNIIERLLYSASEDTVGIQLADLYCYPVWHIFEYNKAPGEYKWFDEISMPKLIRSSTGNLDGYGLKVFPESTKKALRFFS